MTVVVQTPFNQHPGNGVTTLFGFTFQLLAAGDLEVSLDGVVQPTGFTISGLGVQAGGSVTFAVAPANGVVVDIRRRIPLARSTDYQLNGDLPSDQIDQDLDRLWQAKQDAEFNAGLTVQVPLGDTAAPVVLPAVSTRAGRFLAFDGLGRPIAADTLGTGVPVSAFMEEVIAAVDAAAARILLAAAKSGANSDITSLGGLSTALSIAQGGTGQATAAAAFNALKQAATATASGVVELATDAEAATGTDTTRAVTPAGVAAHAAASDFGRGQTWASVTRTAGTTYTNTTGRPIAIACVINGASASASTSIVINGGPSFVISSVGAGTGPVATTGLFIIPAGATYVLSDLNVSVRTTYELR